MIRRLRRALSVASGRLDGAPMSRHRMTGASAIPLWQASISTRMCRGGSSATRRSQVSSWIQLLTRLGMTAPSTGIR